MTNKTKLDIDYLTGLTEHSMKYVQSKYDGLFTGHTEPKTTIAQFCKELKGEMQYQYECDVRDGLTK